MKSTGTEVGQLDLQGCSHANESGTWNKHLAEQATICSVVVQFCAMCPGPVLEEAHTGKKKIVGSYIPFPKMFHYLHLTIRCLIFGTSDKEDSKNQRSLLCPEAYIKQH